MNRVGRALALHELIERLRDRWVVVVTLLFAALASAVSAYGSQASAEGAAPTLTGPSLVTLASLFVPLVALVLSHDAIVGERERNTLGLLLSLPVSRSQVVFAKLLGRGSALTIAVGLGIGCAMLIAAPGERAVLVTLAFPTLLLGLAFLSIGVLLSSLTSRQTVAASMVVVVWFGMVFFYDLGLLGVLVATDGSISQHSVAGLVVANPAGLYRASMMQAFAGAEALSNLGLTAKLPNPAGRAALWALWIVGPAALSALILSNRKVAR